MKPKRLIALALVLLGGALLLVNFDRPPALPAVMILPPGPLVVQSGRVPDRWIPAKWGWLHRACQFVFGPPRQVGFKIQFIENFGKVVSIVAQNSLSQPQAESNGLAVWILPESMLQRPNAAATILSAPRVITADRSQASVGIYGIAGYRADLFPRLEKETVDLSSRLTITSAGQTNIVAALRAQLPYGQGLLVLDVRQPESAARRMEFVIMADEYDAKGNKLHGKAAGK
jgi:hypothetical protein